MADGHCETGEFPQGGVIGDGGAFGVGQDDEVLRQGAWAGRCQHLLCYEAAAGEVVDAFGNGAGAEQGLFLGREVGICGKWALEEGVVGQGFGGSAGGGGSQGIDRKAHR